MIVRILDSARDDLIQGCRFYEKQETGLGDYFLTSLYADIESLKIFCGIHPVAYRGFRRALSKRFPFAIYYTHDQKAILVRAVVDCRQNPSWIRHHVSKRKQSET